MDPRVKTSSADLQKQFDVSMQLYQQLQQVQPALDEATKLRDQLKAERDKSAGNAAKIDAFSQKLNALLGDEGRFRRRRAQTETLNSVQGQLFFLLLTLEAVDAAPTPAQMKAVPALEKSSTALVQHWRELQANDVPNLKSQLGIRDFAPVQPSGSYPAGSTLNCDEE